MSKEKEKRERLNQKQRERYKRTGGKYWKEYYQRNKDKQAEATRKWRKTKKGKKYIKEYNSKPEVKERVKKWRDEHPHYSRDQYRRQKANGKNE